MNTKKGIKITVTLLASMALWACAAAPADGSQESANTKSGSGGKEKTSADGKTDGKTDTKNPATSKSPTEPGGTGQQTPPGGNTTPGGNGTSECSSTSKDEDACYTCCEGKFPKGEASMEKIDDAWTACTCAATACGTQCAQTECNDDNDAESEDGDACDKCMDAQPCDDQWQAACDADADCKKLDQCEDSCDDMEEAGLARAAATKSSKAARHAKILAIHKGIKALKLRSAR